MLHASDNWFVSALVIVLSLIIVLRVVFAQRGRVPVIRRIAGLNAIDEAVGRATEMGRPVLMIPGLGSLDVPTLQAMAIFGHIARAVARFGDRIILPTADPVLTGVAEETIRDAYQDAGRPELMEQNDVHFLTSQQFAYASGVAGILNRERPAASFLFGSFYAESLIFAEVGQQVGAVQVAGTVETNQIPFLITACDYVIIGDEFYAASAYLSRNPTLLGSIVGQDYCKLLLGLIVIVGVLAASLALLFPHASLFHGNPFTWYVNLFKS